ncbi:sulfite exporter TauE/SafE family protein [Streptomyces mesophilus]|uniref:sulfite exporter TauE/SafE family protein n=1 Tax=Streptomyces mesophilus TaxID=1775132 RepID=UPI003330622E
MTAWEMVGVLAAGFGAGAINTVVGSGTLITFPVLLAIGLPPVTATVSNGLGLLPGFAGGVFGYRRELAGQRARVLRFGIVVTAGGLCGAILLLTLPHSAFEMIVPVLVGLALVLIALQPWITKALQRRRERKGQPGSEFGGPWLHIGLFLASVYGGYFTAAQGILYMALMGMFLGESLQRTNAVKNILAAMVNAVAALFFLFAAHFDWTVVLLLAAGSLVGGFVGGTYGRRIPSAWLRGLIVAVGTVALVQLILR